MLGTLSIGQSWKTFRRAGEIHITDSDDQFPNAGFSTRDGSQPTSNVTVESKEYPEKHRPQIGHLQSLKFCNPIPM
jgi:hypothetical protein